MNLLEWFICWVADKRSTLTSEELKEIDILIERIKIELLDSSDSIDFSTLVEDYQPKSSGLGQSHDEKTSSQDTSVDEGIQNPTENKSSESSITSTELYDLMRGDKPGTTLILDIRPKVDFDESKMIFQDVVNIPEDIIIPGNIASKLESLIEPRFRQFFLRRGEYDRVVVVDWSSESYTASENSKIFAMLKVLKHFDINMKYKSLPVMLEGGYEDWISSYPDLTTNSFISLPKKSIDNNFLRVDEMDRNVSNLADRNVFMSLVKIYLKDTKQINISHQSLPTESSSIMDEELQLDHDSNEEDCLMCRSQETDVQSNSDSCSLTTNEKTDDEMNCSTETSPDQTNGSNSDAASEGRSPISSKTVETCKKLRHIRQDLKKLASDCLKVGENPNTNAITLLNEALSRNRLELEAVNVEVIANNARLNAAHEVLVEHTENLVARLETFNASNSASNEQPPNGETSKPSSMNRIEQVRKLAERINEDIKLSLFDSSTDKEFLNFDEKLTNCLIQLDCILCSDESSLATRKKVVNYVHELICHLEIKLLLDRFLTNNIEDPSSCLTVDETIHRLEEVDSLISSAENLSNTFGCHVDEYFSKETLSNKCFAQLSYIACLDDEDLLSRLQKQIDRLLPPSKSTSNLCEEQVPHNSAIIDKGFESIKKVEQESERLNFHIEFGDFQSRTDRIYIYVDEMLTKLLINLDAICCDGNEQMRSARRKAIRYINQLTENLEAKVPA